MRRQAHTAPSGRVSIETLVPDARNANKGTKRGAVALKKSLSDLGIGRSILVDRDGRIIAGNKTAEQAKAAGIREVVLVPSDGSVLVAVQRTDLSLDKDSRAKRLAIADNRTGELNLDWDIGNLAAIANETSLEGFFDEKEMGALLAGLGATSGASDDVPDLPKKATSKSGTLYKLGRHRLLCGDATRMDDLKRLMGREQADMVWTDPPYNVAYSGKTKEALTIENDKMGDADFREFLLKAFTALLAVTKAGGPIYVSTPPGPTHLLFIDALVALEVMRQTLIWVKNAMVLGRSDFHYQHEPILYGWKPGASHNWYSDRKQTTVLNFDRPTRSTEHPTMKPVALVEYCIRNSSPKKAIVLDPFGGSGTTLMAAESTGRSARLLELDPRYCDVIVQRWQEHTGKKAEVA